MFDIGGGELVVIGIVALVAIGPKELPTVLRTVGRYMGKVKRMSAEFQSQFQEALREADMADLKKHADDIKSSVSEFSHFDPLTDHNAPASAEGSTAEAVAAAAATDTVAAEAAAVSGPPDLAAPVIDVTLPEPLPPVSNADFAPAAPAVPAEPVPAAESPPVEAPKRAGDAA